MKVLGIIPARYNSSRLPGKPLADIMGTSMIQRVYEQASKCKQLRKVIVATDDERISFHVKSFGGKVIMTSKNHESGTDRCGEVAEKIERNFDVIVNIQGDEPFINPEQINQVIQLFNEESTQIATLSKRFNNFENFTDENKVKVKINTDGFADDFYRTSVINEIEFSERDYFKHIGIYAFKSDVLQKIVNLPKSKTEEKLNLEQLRWLDNKYKIKVGITKLDALSVDRIEDIEKIVEFHEKNV
jgi:3-deoxy-manno-octulosonate cytidylyltransferase (CMP-KDO synthetase)